MNIPKISIQIPTYNQSDLILRAVQSCLVQTYRDIEIIIADDCSTDDTEFIVSSIVDDRIKYFKNPKNLGRVGNYQHSLLNYCTGDWVVNLDGDDYFIDENFLKTAVEQLSRIENKNVVLFMAQNPLLNKIAKMSNCVLNDGVLRINGLRFLEKYSYYPSFFHLSSIYNRAVALKKSFYSIDCLISDFASVMQLADQGDFLISDKVVGKWDVNENSASRSLNINNNKKNVQALESLIDNLSFENDDQKKEVLKQLMYVNNYRLVSATASKKDFLKSVINFMKLASFRKFYYWKGFARFIIKG